MKFPEKYKVEDFNIKFSELKEQQGIYSQCFIIPFKGRALKAIASNWKNGWEHVSISLNNRCPNWPEMCYIKNLFWEKDEICIQFHPKEEEYVNLHNYCLHIWKPPIEIALLLNVN